MARTMNEAERLFENVLSAYLSWVNAPAGHASVPHPHDLYIQKRAALIEAMMQGVPQWQTMDTAPKDGTHILVWDASDDGDGPVGVLLVSWDIEEIFYPNSQPIETWCVYGSHQDEQGGCMTARNPTHWMHLPTKPLAAPVAAQEAA